jgi:site-specific DNA-methyltransferase (adenine-specific)
MTSRGEVVCGDAADVLRAMLRKRSYDPTDVVVIVDPSWPGCEHVPIHGAEDPVGAFKPTAKLLHRVAPRVVVWLGHNTDSRQILAPIKLPLRTIVTLRFVPPGYRGCLMGGDLAYVFADRLCVPEGCHVLPGEFTSNGPEHRHERGRLKHPCPRSPMHARGLVRWYAARSRLIIDPMCGSGTTLAAAAELGIPYLGIDSDPRWVDESRERLDRVERQGLLFDGVREVA